MYNRLHGFQTTHAYTSFEDVHASDWLSPTDLIGFLTELDMVETTYKRLEIPVPEHFELKRQELVAAVRVTYRVEMLKRIVQLEQQVKYLRTPEEQRTDAKNEIDTLKARLGIEAPQQIE